ncbi:MAG: hypothetical protein AB8U93_01215 [Francisella endosymbiont of Hyalomma scupense]
MKFIEEAYIGKRDTHINDGAWLGTKIIIMPRITIGEGAILASNTVVNKMLNHIVLLLDLQLNY